MIAGCIFDLDGVIVDTARYHYMAWRRLAAELGFDFTEEQNEALKGVSRMASLEILLADGREAMGEGLGEFTDAQKEDMAARKNRWYVKYISRMTPVEILPGVERFLGELRRAEMKIALGSASRNARTILDRVGLAPMFDAVVDGGMVSEAKPSPGVFLLAAELLDVPPAECVVFEDAEAGIEAARRAGMRSVGVGTSPTLAAAAMRIPGFTNFTLTKLKQIDIR